MILYFVDNSIHQVPSFIHICRVTGGKVLTDGPDIKGVIERDHPGVDVEFLAERAAVERRMQELSPSAVVHPDFTANYFPNVRTNHVQVFHGTSDKPYNLDKRLQRYALVLLPGRKMRDDLARVGLLDKLRTEVVGYSKLDRVFTGELSRDAKLRELGLDPLRPTVLYAPTWRDAYGNSSIPRYGREVLSGVPQDVNLIVKLHPNTKKYDRKFYPVLAGLAADRPNIRLIDYAPDIIPIMAASDLLIGDVSTVTHEYLAFNRPLVFLDSIFRYGGKWTTWIWQTGDIVKKRGRVWPAVMDRLTHPEVHRAKREEIFRYVFHEPDGRAAERAAAAIMKLERPQP